MLGGVPKTQMPLRYYVFDAFTNSIFKGNPAAVVFLPQNYRATIPDSLLQSIALEFNLAETAFVSPRTTAGHFDLRWFTPTIEFPLCGHATLATAAALLLYESQTSLTEVSFYTLSGILHARRLGLPDCRIEIELPAGDVTALSTTDSEKVAKVILQAFSKVTIKFIGTGSGTSFQHYLLVEVEDVSLEDAQINSTPLNLLRPRWEVIIFTQRPPHRYPSDSVQPHFVSRVFCPLEITPEDPVTGSAHCMLGPYWAARLDMRSADHEPQNIPELRATQVSSRGGSIGIIWDEQRNMCRLRGNVQLFAKGELFCDMKAVTYP